MNMYPVFIAAISTRQGIHRPLTFLVSCTANSSSAFCYSTPPESSRITMLKQLFCLALLWFANTCLLRKGHFCSSVYYLFYRFVLQIAIFSFSSPNLQAGRLCVLSLSWQQCPTLFLLGNYFNIKYMLSYASLRDT